MTPTADATPSSDADDSPAPLVIQMPVDIRHVALTLGAAVALIWLLKTAQDVLIPFVVSAMLFYALDPFVDRLERWRVPRGIGALVMLLSVVAAIGATGYYLSDQFMSVVEQVPTSVRKLRDELQKPAAETGALSKVQQAADAIDRTAAEGTAPTPAPRGVVRVQVEDPGFRMSDYVSSGWKTLPALAGVAVMIFFLTLFLLIADDLFKRKLVKHVGAFSRKRVTVQILDEIGQQMERFILVQIFTSAIVAVATFAALWWLGLEHAAVWGLVAGLLNSIPYFGPVVVTIAIAVVGYMQFGEIAPTLSVAGRGPRHHDTRRLGAHAAAAPPNGANESRSPPSQACSSGPGCGACGGCSWPCRSRWPSRWSATTSSPSARSAIFLGSKHEGSPESVEVRSSVRSPTCEVRAKSDVRGQAAVLRRFFVAAAGLRAFAAC